MQIRLIGAAILSVALAACASEATFTPASGGNGGGTGTGNLPSNPDSPAGTGTTGTGTTGTKSGGTSGTPGDPGTPSEPAGTAGRALSVHTSLGIPEAASADDPQHALVVKPQYVLSFDSTRKNPRWTSWELTTTWLGSTSRSLTFVPDPMLPSTILQAKQSDYTNSGFSRGHLCPSADRTDSVDDNESTFVFTNVVPQTTQSNTGPWEDLEREERDLATAGHHLFITAGSRYETVQTIGDGVAVPSSMFKVIVVLDGDAPTADDVTASTRVIAVDIPNTTTVSGAYTDFLVSFGTLESESGLRFMNDVPASIHDALAAKTDTAH